VRLIEQEVAPTENPSLSEWLARKIISANAAISSILELNHKDQIITSEASYSTQNNTVVDSKKSISFGPGVSGDNISINATGLITFNIPGSYSIRVVLNCSISGAAASHLLITVDTNGSAAGISIVNSMDSSIYYPVDLGIIPFKAAKGDTMQFFQIRDSSGANDGGLYPFPPALIGIAEIPSARIEITKTKMETL